MRPAMPPPATPALPPRVAARGAAASAPRPRVELSGSAATSACPARAPATCKARPDAIAASLP